MEGTILSAYFSPALYPCEGAWPCNVAAAVFGSDQSTALELLNASLMSADETAQRL